jgi:hypothetical protein
MTWVKRKSPGVLPGLFFFQFVFTADDAVPAHPVLPVLR